MASELLQVEGVTKKIRNRKLIDHLSFTVQQGDICGFLGPNGAGKTTMIRMITGLIRPTRGDVKVGGISLRKNRQQALLQMGAIVESPIFFPYMSGRKNLRNLARLHPNLEKSRQEKKVTEVLKLVGLSDRAEDKVGTYSLGMKQRLGIAQALLGEPKFIVLDEPANGLDPMGMKFLRELILKLRDQYGITFFISSHLLDEIQMICDRLIMIREGKLVWQGQLHELEGQVRWVYRVSDANRAMQVLQPDYEVTRLSTDTVEIQMEEVEAGKVNERLIREGVAVMGIEKRSNRLEDVFLEMMGS